MIALFLDKVKPEYFYRAKEFIENRIYYFDKLDIPHKVFYDLDEFLNYKDGKKVAVLHNNFTHSPATADFLEIFPKIKDESDLIFLVESENPCANIEDYVNIPNLIFVLPGFLSNNILNNKIIFKPTWFEIPVMLYKSLPGVLETLNPYSVKSKYFDVLLGVNRPHREYIYELFCDNNLINQNIVNYHQRYLDQPEKNTDFILEPNITRNFASETVDLKKAYSVIHVEYYGIITHLASIVSLQVYNQTAYSVVAETKTSSNFHLFTEKITKPILARRLFVVFAGKGYLQGLKKAGFKTFEGIIDESYDNEDDDRIRWQMAFEQIKFLCNQNQDEILSKIKDIVDHNYYLMMETPWADIAIDQMISKVKNLTN